jgi:hypothetical protein
VKRVTDAVLISFDNLNEYDEFKDYTDPVFSDDIMKVFSNTDEWMAVLDDIIHDMQTDRVAMSLTMVTENFNLARFDSSVTKLV